MVRARKVFEVRSAIVVTQGFHMAVTGAWPRFLGPKVPVTGDAAASRG